MMNRDPIFVADCQELGRKVSLLKSISAVQLVPGEDGRATIGAVSQLAPGNTVQYCGDGFDQRTVKVRANGRLYYVFAQDLESQTPGRRQPRYRK